MTISRLPFQHFVTTKSSHLATTTSSQIRRTLRLLRLSYLRSRKWEQFRNNHSPSLPDSFSCLFICCALLISSSSFQIRVIKLLFFHFLPNGEWKRSKWIWVVLLVSLWAIWICDLHIELRERGLNWLTLIFYMFLGNQGMKWRGMKKKWFWI